MTPQIPDLSQITNEEIIELFECVEHPSIELTRDAYVARDIVMFGEDTNNIRHEEYRLEQIDKFKCFFYSNEDEDTLTILIDASQSGNIVEFYGCLNEIQLEVLGW
jgi:hypothetical protein